MFKKCLLIILVCIGLVAFMVGQASAGCSSNPRWCCTCLPGSLICKELATQLGPIYKECSETTELDCPVGSLTIFGTQRQNGNKYVEDIAYCSNIDPTNRDTWKGDCSILVWVECDNPDSPPHSPKKPSGVAVPYNNPITLQTGTELLTCAKNGNCKSYVVLDVDVPEGVCKEGWTQIGTGRIDSYIQSADFCKGGWVCPGGSVLSGDGAQCCTDGTIDADTGRCSPENEITLNRICCGEPGRNEDGSCTTTNIGTINSVQYDGVSTSVTWLGGPTRVFEVCRYDEGDPTIFGDEFYNCKPCTPKTWDTTEYPYEVTDWTCPTD